MTTRPDSPGGSAMVRAGVLRLVAFVALWFVLVEGGEGWLFGSILAVAVTLASLWLTPPARFVPHLTRLPRFAAFFLWQSLRAGVDVARRTLTPALPLRPAVLELRITLPEGAPTWWLMTLLSLLPGTLSVGLHGRRLELHCLDARRSVADEVGVAQAQVARLFALPEHRA